MHENQKLGSCNVFVKDSMFTLPKEAPLIMIGPGTGIVPFIGFLETFMATAPYSNKTSLYFGCRSESKDFIYKEFLEK